MSNNDLMLVDMEVDRMLDADSQFVTMYVGKQLFGVPILRIQDIVEPTHITPVPLAPAAIAGVLNLRGRIVTVIDVRECLGGEYEAVSTSHHRMGVTVEYKGDLYTLLVDRIGDVCSLPKSQFEAVPGSLSPTIKRLCSGVFRLSEGLLVVLDVERILDEETLTNTTNNTSVWQRHRDVFRARQHADSIEEGDGEPEKGHAEEQEEKVEK